MAEDVKEGREVQKARSGGRRKGANDGENEMERQRFFLSKANGSSGLLDLGKELATEPEAIVESLKTGLSYFSVVEWRGIADFSGKKPQLKKAAVPRVQNSS